MAGELGRAAHYLELAGDHAASAFANDEAVASYRYALDLIERDGIDKPGPVSNTTVRAETELRLKLALVLSTMARYAEARDTLLQGLRLVGDSDELLAACLQSRLGWVELDVHEYDRALIAFESATALLGTRPEHLEPRLFEVWLDSQLGLGEVYYWRDEPDRMAAVLGRVSPVIESKGVPRRKRADYYQSVLLWQLTERRHRVDEGILDNARKALRAAEEASAQLMICSAIFNLGFCLLWYGDLDGAEARLTESLQIADRIGATNKRAISMSYLNLLALRRQDPAAVAVLAPKAIEATNEASRPQYAAMAKASLAWLAWRTGQTGKVEERAREALASWPVTSWQPFHWIYLWPLIAVRLSRGRWRRRSKRPGSCSRLLNNAFPASWRRLWRPPGRPGTRATTSWRVRLGRGHRAGGAIALPLSPRRRKYAKRNISLFAEPSEC